MRPKHQDGFLKGLGVVAFHTTMGLCTTMVASLFGWRTAFIYALVSAIYVEFKDGA